MLTLGISTASGQFAIALGEAGELKYCSQDYMLPNELDVLLQDGLNRLELPPQAIGSIVVDVGPGGTSRVRTGVAFANSLAYTLGVPLFPVSSVELAGVEVWEKFALSAVTTVKSVKGNAYVGLFRDGRVDIRFGLLREVVPPLVEGLSSFAMVGYHRAEIVALPALQGKEVTDTNLLFGDVCYLVLREDLFKNRKGLLFPEFAQPILEHTL